MSGEPQAWLEAALARAERVARGAGSWSATAGGWVVSDNGHLLLATRSMVEHVELHGPAAVLRRIGADRALLADLLAERHEVVWDCWYTCTAATEERDGGTSCREDDASAVAGACSCGRDERVGRRVRLLAEGWGWQAVG